jgi:hypothetical protein
LDLEQEDFLCLEVKMMMMMRIALNWLRNGLKAGFCEEHSNSVTKGGTAIASV